MSFVLIKENENLTKIESMDSNERDAVSYYNTYTTIYVKFKNFDSDKAVGLRGGGSFIYFYGVAKLKQFD